MGNSNIVDMDLIAPEDYVSKSAAIEIKIALKRRVASMWKSYEESNMIEFENFANNAARAYLEFTGEPMSWVDVDTWVSTEYL